MTARTMRPLIAVFALLMSMLCAVDAQACTSCGTPAISYYQPATYSASYQPVAYQTYYPTTTYSGWYPGYWMDRWSARVATPTVYTTAYQPAYTVGYAGYATSYAPSCSSCSTCSSCTAAYSPCSSCSSCSSCGTVQQVTMMPVVSSGCGCDTCGSSCGCTSSSGCSSCGSSGVTQAAFVESAPVSSGGCSSCGQSSAPSNTTFVPVPNNATQMQTAPQGGQQQIEPTPAPTIPQGQTVAPERTEMQKPADSTVQPPPPGSGTQGQPTGQPESSGSGTNGAYFEAPKLFNPNDKTARKMIGSAAPVTVAVYEKPVASTPAAAKVSGKPVTWQQAQQDAVGWTSASH